MCTKVALPTHACCSHRLSLWPIRIPTSGTGRPKATHGRWGWPHSQAKSCFSMASSASYRRRRRCASFRCNAPRPVLLTRGPAQPEPAAALLPCPPAALLQVWLVLGDCTLIGLAPVLVQAAKDADGHYGFSPVSVNLLVELCKTIFALGTLITYVGATRGARPAGPP